MKRDMDLIKRIMEKLETLKPGSSANDSAFVIHFKLDEEGGDRGTFFEHIYLLYEEKYIFCRRPQQSPSREPEGNQINPSSVDIMGLTWKGYDLLNSLREKT